MSGWPARFRRPVAGKAREPKPRSAMNGLEAAYALLLDADPSVAAWVYEGIKLRLADGAFYTGDFAICRDNGALEIHEVKAEKKVSQRRDQTFKEASRVRIKVAAERYPWFRFVVARKAGPRGWNLEEVK
jgi:hypothetical protein